MKQRAIEQFERRILFAGIEFSPASEHIGNIGRATQVLVADMDGDNDLDIVTPHEWFENDLQQRNFSVLHPFVGGTTSGRSHSSTIALADIDGDNDVDILFSSGGFPDGALGPLGQVDVFDNSGENLSVLALRQSFSMELGGADNIQVGDIDGDGDLDAISNLSDYFGRWFGFIAWHENVDGEFVTHELPFDGRMDVGRTTLVDIDGDGDLDVFTPLNIWFENGGERGFSERQFYPGVSIPGVIDSGDIDRDGDQDIVAVQRKGGILELSWFENVSGDGSFETQAFDSVENLRQIGDC